MPCAGAIIFGAVSALPPKSDMCGATMDVR
jgi:hypothetical protein